jgi:hypothetical protein
VFPLDSTTTIAPLVISSPSPKRAGDIEAGAGLECAAKRDEHAGILRAVPAIRGKNRLGPHGDRHSTLSKIINNFNRVAEGMGFEPTIRG